MAQHAPVYRKFSLWSCGMRPWGLRLQVSSPTSELTLLTNNLAMRMLHTMMVLSALLSGNFILVAFHTGLSTRRSFQVAA